MPNPDPTKKSFNSVHLFVACFYAFVLGFLIAALLSDYICSHPEPIYDYKSVIAEPSDSSDVWHPLHPIDTTEGRWLEFNIPYNSTVCLYNKDGSGKCWTRAELLLGGGILWDSISEAMIRIEKERRHDEWKLTNKEM